MASHKEDSTLRQWLLATVVTILLGVGSCVGHSFSAKLDALEEKQHITDTDNAVIKQDLKDFRQSFEEFKADWNSDSRLHRPDSGAGR